MCRRTSTKDPLRQPPNTNRRNKSHEKCGGFAGWESQLLRTGGRGGSVAEDVAKFAPRLRARAIWKSKSLKIEGAGALLEVQVAKICTTPAHESGSEVKITNN